ncbi:MAG: exo-alpha-sialidase [Arenimonas sp.]|nr:exo-alpha-sialidase [Arenimonas sp.]MBP6626304.1 exo-alpha-sialidase [Arenimonas sp.]
MRRVLAALLCLPALCGAATVQDWPLPAPPASAQPNLAQAPNGDLLLSWIERKGDHHRLMFSRYPPREPTWSPPQVIAQGKDWFVNWADFPALQALPDGSLWAHLLVKNGDAPYAYDVQLHASRDGGRSWQLADPVHTDGTPTEHGFASLWPRSGAELGIVWLDGRNTRGGHDHASHGGGGMSLRAAVFDARGRRRDERELDPMTCDCCQTDAAVGAKGVLVAYRDRDPGEVRDIKLTRFDGTAWTAPASVHADGWVMPACPVNGPAIAARGDQAWVAWYTEAGGAPSLRLARSVDAGAHFSAPKIVSSGAAQLGRVDLAADAGGVWVSWLQEAQGQQSLWLAKFSPDLASERFRVRVADVAGRGRATGFPRLQVRGGTAWLAWTEVRDGQPRLRGARILP